MNHRELQKRLKDLGISVPEEKLQRINVPENKRRYISIPEGTLTRWVSEGLIPGPTARFEKSKKGKPGKPGRFMDWPEEAVEQAAAVWVLRNRFDYSQREQVPIKPGKRRRVPNKTIALAKGKGTTLHNLLQTDCKAASRFLRTILDKKGIKVVGENNDVVSRIIHSRDEILCSFIVVWILTVEKARRRIPITKKLHLTCRWAIQADGEMLFEEPEVNDDEQGIRLEITHLNPLRNGFSVEYGFPQVDLFLNDGFVDVFDLGPLWNERFQIRLGATSYEDFSDKIDPKDLPKDFWLLESEYEDYY
jgi:hypothetical protein